MCVDDVFKSGVSQIYTYKNIKRQAATK